MIIREEKRDLFTVPQGYYLAHCISRDFALGAGIAKQFDDIYDMRNKLKFLYNYHKVYIGDAILVDNVFNLITKERSYEKPEYAALEECLCDLRFSMEDLLVSKLAIPRIGCGLDGLDWNEVKIMIKDIFYDSHIEILVCYR